MRYLTFFFEKIYLTWYNHFVLEIPFKISPDSGHGLSPLAGPDSIRQLCYQEARELVETQLDSRSGTQHHVTSTPIITLVTGLTSLMLQIKVDIILIFFQN